MTPVPDRPEGGAVCLITGATSGLGAAAAEALARDGRTVVLLGRSRERCEAAADRVRARAGNPAVEYLVADLSAQAEVRRAAREFRGRHRRLDVLINNAGGLFLERRESADGIELTFALNHLAPFLLANLLLDRMIASAPARVINVASGAHTMVRGLDFEDLQGRGRYRGLRAYARSKLANLLFTAELARRLEGTGVTVNALHPGLVATNIFAGRGWSRRLMRLGARLFGARPERGALTMIYLATAPEVAGVSGRYFVRQKPHPTSPAAADEAAARRLWEVSEALTGLTAGGRA